MYRSYNRTGMAKAAKNIIKTLVLYQLNICTRTTIGDLELGKSQDHTNSDRKTF